MTERRTVDNVNMCANCGACANCCPTNAIVIDDASLFYRPTVDHTSCVQCGQCVAVCPVLKNDAGHQPLSAWWGRSRDEELVKNSSSGGLFSVLAELVLQDGGVVYAAAFDDDCKTLRIRSTDEVSLEALRRSKYVESLVDDTFARVKDHLKAGRTVLYCATPCQISGLKSYLKKDYDMLYTCDFACGGLPSHATYRDYIDSLEHKYGSRVTSVNFRPKTFGWKTYAVKITFANGKQYLSPASLDPFFNSFIGKHINIRDNCVDCRFAENHVSDVVLADFWRHDAIIGKPSDDKGLSLLLANTEKGQRLIDRACAVSDLQELDVTAASYNLKNPSVSAAYRETRRQYFAEYERSGLKAAAGYISDKSALGILKTRIKCALKGLAKRVK